MALNWTNTLSLGKQTFKKKTFSCAALISILALTSACSVNPATGQRQFTAALPAANEAKVGATEHAKIEAQFGKFMTGPIATYVNQVGQRVAANTERKDIQYRFYVLDTPMVNAFALPGGYTYFSRGLLTLANSEAELAAVIGHEIGHITARHAASRMSQGMVAGIGAAVLGAAVGGNAGQLASLGSNLYLSSYSRGQEHQSDELGVRYLSRAGYDPTAMSTFLASLDAQSKLQAKEAGKSGSGFNYFSTPPLTGERVQHAHAEATKYPANNNESRAAYLSKINGLIYGDSPSQGFAKGNQFYHPEMNFTFTVPNGTKISNGTSQVAGQHPNGTAIVFDAGKSQSRDPVSFVQNEWLKGQGSSRVEAITVNGKRGATTSFAGNVQGKAVTIRLVAVEWSANQYYRFQMAIPNGVSNAFLNELKQTTYSLRNMSGSERASIQPRRLRVLVAPAGSTVASMAARMKVDGNKTEHFLVLNGLDAHQGVVAGQPYKIVSN